MSPSPSVADILRASLPVWPAKSPSSGRTCNSRCSPRWRRKSLLSGKKMEERLLLDGIDVGGDDPRINQRVIGPIPVLTDPAIAAVAVLDDALTRTQFAPNRLVGQFLVEPRFDP